MTLRCWPISAASVPTAGMAWLVLIMTSRAFHSGLIAGAKRQGAEVEGLPGGPALMASVPGTKASFLFGGSQAGITAEKPKNPWQERETSSKQPQTPKRIKAMVLDQCR